VSDEGDDWDSALASRLDGALVLIGLTYADPEESRQEQVFGTVLSVNRREGVRLRLEGKRYGETFKLPPDLSAFEPAEPGSYHLRSTGETVVDPDYTTTWTISSPKN
jgi:hypothetical protein